MEESSVVLQEETLVVEMMESAEAVDLDEVETEVSTVGYWCVVICLMWRRRRRWRFNRYRIFRR